MNNINVGEFIVMYTEGKGEDEHTQWQSFGSDKMAFDFYKKVLKQKGVNRDTVTIYKQV